MAAFEEEEIENVEQGQPQTNGVLAVGAEGDGIALDRDLSLP
jgi:hypothetical protein